STKGCPAQCRQPCKPVDRSCFQGAPAASDTLPMLRAAIDIRNLQVVPAILRGTRYYYTSPPAGQVFMRERRSEPILLQKCRGSMPRVISAEPDALTMPGGALY